MSETDLITRARQGDEAAWTTLVRRHQEAAFRLAYLILGETEEAEDVAQEAFIRAFRWLDQFDTGRPFRPWLLGITKNLAYNRQRSVRRYLDALRRSVRAAPEPVVNPEAERWRQQAAELLWQAVRRLNPMDQQVPPTATATPLASVLDLAGATTLEEAQAQVAHLRPETELWLRGFSPDGRYAYVSSTTGEWLGDRWGNWRMKLYVLDLTSQRFMAERESEWYVDVVVGSRVGELQPQGRLLLPHLRRQCR